MRALHLRNLTSFPTRRSSDLATDHAWTLISDQGVGAPTEEVVAQGLEESKKFIRVLVEAQRELAGQSAKEVQEFRSEERRVGTEGTCRGGVYYSDVICSRCRW